MQTGRLHGKLEELGLDDILHIIGVSRRTGILTLSSQGGTAVLHFADGLLVRAASSACRQYLGELLVENGSVSPQNIQQALLVQQQIRPRLPIGAILHQQFQIDLKIIEAAVRQQINLVLQSLLSWTVGEFDFSSLAMIETVDAAYLDPEQLVIELHDTDSADASDNASDNAKAGELAPTTVPTPQSLMSETVTADQQPGGRPCLIIADDDCELAQNIAQAFSDTFEVTVFSFAEEAAAVLERLQGTSASLTILTDLIMPKADGSGVLAGLEFSRRLHEQGCNAKIITMTDFPLTDAADQLAAWGYPLLMKPRRGTGSGELLTVFLEQLRQQLLTEGENGGR